jgi:hypothetical protein
LSLAGQSRSFANGGFRVGYIWRNRTGARVHRSDEFEFKARRRFADLGYVFAIAVAVAVAGCASPKDLPALLAHATAGSGWGSACPGRNDNERAMMAGRKLAVSLELSDRLGRQFPLGSPASVLKEELSTDGFEAPTACEADPTIMSATFFQKGSGLLPYDVNASVYWKVAGDGKIVWTKGFIFYQGL